MFQYATARRICLDKNIPFLLLNTDNYKYESPGRNFSLINYAIKGKLLKDNAIAKIFRTGTKANTILSTLRLYGSTGENGFKIQTIRRQGRPFISLVGYWQSEYYFKDIREQLLQELKPLQIPSLPICIKLANTVAIHVRRADYLTEERYGFLGKSYYLDAIAKMKNLLTNPTFIFFSDDMEWCKNEFKESGNIFFDEAGWEKDYLQLYAMSQCRHQVIANSSFSWWGAWLNNNTNKIIIRPARPFKDNSLEHESYYPDDWISVNND